jgi:hypothetical protein
VLAEITRITFGRAPAGTAGSGIPSPRLDASSWLSDEFDFWMFNRSIDEARSLILIDDAGCGERFPSQVTTYCQRRIAARNAHSATPLFERILDLHRLLHDLRKPLVRADYDHSLDTWQWVLRLDPEAPFALQAAALLHDVERLVSEPDERVEQHAADYQAFKDAHARTGAAMAAQLVRDAGASEDEAVRIAELIVHHEQRSADDTLGDADALSFFSLNSSGYADYFGPEQTRKKIDWTWRRISPEARARVSSLRLRRDVRTLLAEMVNDGSVTPTH